MHLQLVQGWVQVIQSLKMWIWKKKFDVKNARDCPGLLKNAIFRKKFTKKKVKRVHCSKFDTNILGLVLTTVQSFRTIAFKLKELFQSLRADKKRCANFFWTFFFVFHETGVASMFHAELKPFYFWSVQTWGFHDAFKISNGAIVFF